MAVPSSIPPSVDPAATREHLLALRARLQGDYRALQRDALDSGGDVRAPLHPADAATDTQDHEFSAQLLSGSADMLEDIDDALERLQEGQYGICEECDKPIGAGRLRAKPWARLCIDCKSREEKESGR